MTLQSPRNPLTTEWVNHTLLAIYMIKTPAVSLDAFSCQGRNCFYKFSEYVINDR
ncbi:hypothetical protein A359_07970 [secondary endosymbiont of Ctenarytaina eucalypti]|uniref:Uncharacterized protein n=1 Tax=secondary endosymbiont of Ctenarytaina eucalypti TaxID=1199245 RepID=J3VT74_9ENTR|nr:hypothetical protein A359_07970 [secondary endosymbiont of Ctenarytaina eucalypti]